MLYLCELCSPGNGGIVVIHRIAGPALNRPWQRGQGYVHAGLGPATATVYILGEPPQVEQFGGKGLPGHDRFS